MSETFDFIDLLSIDKLTENKLYKLLENFGSPKAIKDASKNDLKNIVGADIAQRILSFKTDDKIIKMYDLIERLSIAVLPYYASDYPAWLKNIEHYPPVLFVRGQLIPDDEISIAIIGTRGATVYGKEIAKIFATEFVKSGVTIVSGMARGVDTEAHLGAINNGGRTVAVFGCGIDICYPPENKNLMNDVISSGAVISEFNLSTPPLAQNFPIRNRIVSGLAKGVVAIEAKEKSGVMNTVKWALQQNKDVFAIPGNIYSKTSYGTNRLIKDGAIPVTSADEVMDYLGIKYTRKEKQAKEVLLNEEEKIVWSALSFEPIYLDALAEKLNKPTSTILNVILGLEIKGIVKQLPGMMFVKSFDEF